MNPHVKECRSTECVSIKARELPGVRLQSLFTFIFETAYLIVLGLTR